MRMYRVVSTLVVLITMVFSFICTPVVAYCFSANLKKDAAVCKIADRKECHHRACPMKTEAAGHHHAGPSAQACKTFIKCAGAGQSALNHASFDETVFLLSNTGPLNGQDVVSFIPEYIAPCQKDPSLPVEVPPKL